MKTKVSEFSKDMLSISISLLQHKDSTIRMNSLKLLGSLMAEVGDHVFSNDSALIIRVQSQLASLSNIDPSIEVRTLAEKFLHILNEKVL